MIRVSRASLLSLLALTVPGCPTAEYRLLVDVRTDLVPDVEFTSVRVLTDAGELRTHEVSRSDDYIAGRRVAELEMGEGTLGLRVSLLSSSGAVVLERRAVVDVRGSRGLVVVLSRVCQSVDCPRAGDPANATVCAGMRCVPPECTSVSPEACGEPECTTGADCPAVAACAESECVEGTCLYRACVPAPIDAGVADGGGPTDADARDAGASDAGGLDAGTPPGCADGTPCDDGNPCTHGDRCSGGGCSGAAYSCGVSADCTLTSCDGAGGCSPGASACGAGSTCDGAGACVPCGGVDQRCCGGTCSGGLGCLGDVCTCAQPGNVCCPWDMGCEPGSACRSGTCTPCGGPGATCVFDDECCSNRCSSFVTCY